MGNSLEIAPIAISLVALTISGITLWLTHLRLGTVKITRPSQIYLGPDGEVPHAAKIVVRTLLYSTSSRGRCVDQLFVKLSRGESSHCFSVWVHGQGSNLVRAAGLMVGPNGVDRMHHFLISQDANFEFQAGEYKFELFMEVVGERKPKLAFAQTLLINDRDARAMNSPFEGLFFDWGPESRSYLKTVRPTRSDILVPKLEHPETQK